MNTLMSPHIVWFARIYKEVGLCSCCDTSFEESEAMLWHYCHIIKSLYDLQFSFEILSLIEQ